MEMLSEENYLIAKAKEATDPFKAKAMILAAKTLYPDNFTVQFEAYLIEKNAENHAESAKMFTYIVLTFQTQSTAMDRLWNEIKKLTEALRAQTQTPEQEFYVKMFQFIGIEVQHKILLLTANNNSDNNLDHCRLILLLLKRFPQANSTHAPRLLETLIQGVAPQFKEMLVLEALPLIFQKPPDNLPPHLIHRVMSISFEYYITQMVMCNDDKNSMHANWKKIFETLDLCGKILKWEHFMKYNKNWSKDIYWQKLIEIVKSAPTRPSENKQILFVATILFVLSLQEYIKAINLRPQSQEGFVLLEIKDPSVVASTKRRKIDLTTTEADIYVQPPNTPEISTCLKVAAKCWQLLHSNEILQIDFSKLIMHIPQITKWISRFLLDLSVYLGRTDEANTLMNESDALEMSPLEKKLRMLSLTMNHPNFNIEIYDYILPILQNLPPNIGKYVNFVKIPTPTSRQLILLPLTRKAVLEYCVKTIIITLKQKIQINPNSNDLLGHLLVLSQLNWPMESAFAEKIFDLIRGRKSFTYLQFANYIINIDIIEEFAFLRYQTADLKLDFGQNQTPTSAGSSRRISTRGTDKGVKEVIRQQVSKSNDNVEQLIINFVQQEHPKLINCAETIDLSSTL